MRRPDETQQQFYERLEKLGQEIEKDFTKSAFYQAFVASGKSILEIWTPTDIERKRPQ